MWKILEKRPFFRADLAGLGKCRTGGFGRIGVNRVKLAKGIYIAHMNVRSITNKWEVFKTHFSSSNLHILGVSETCLNDKLPSELFLLSKDYCLYRNDREWSEPGLQNYKKGGGVAVCIKNSLVSTDKEFQHLNKSCKDIE